MVGGSRPCSSSGCAAQSGSWPAVREITPPAAARRRGCQPAALPPAPAVCPPLRVPAPLLCRCPIRTICTAAVELQAAAQEGAQPLVENLKVAIFSAQPYVLDYLQKPLEAAVEPENLRFIEARLDKQTAELAHGCDVACLFVNDNCDAKAGWPNMLGCNPAAQAVDVLADVGVKFIAMRCAGFDKVDLEACAKRGIRVVRVPAYSPRSVAEHAFALAFTLARELQLQLPRTRQGNYTLNGIVGIELSYKTYGVIGTGNIGLEMIKLLRCLDGRILCYDPYPNEQAKALGAEYVSLEELLRQSDLVSLHPPLMPSTFHLINAERLALMKPSAILINVSRGGLIDTNSLILALEANQLRGVAMDVYENEGNLFDTDYTDFSTQERMTRWDRRFAYLKSLPQAIITPHSAFLTQEALQNIADTTVDNLRECAQGGALTNEVKHR